MEKLLGIQTENPMEEPGRPIQKLTSRHRIIILSIVIPACSLIALYFGMVQYFMNRFYYGTEINYINVSGKTVEDVQAEMTSTLQAYALNLKERGGRIEQIKADDIGLRYDLDIRRLKGGQNPYKWLLTCLAQDTKEDLKITAGYAYNEALLKECLDKLSCLDGKNIIEPQNPTFKYINKRYIIIDEVPGSKIDKGILYSRVAQSILNGEAEIDLESAGCYVKPRYSSKSKRTIQVKNTLNRYVSSQITYDFGDSRTVLDGSVISKWLGVDENLNIVLDEEKVDDYVDNLAKTYNTIGRTRDFRTSSGQTIRIGGGDYGWSINKEEEVQGLIAAIKEGGSVSRQPIYKQTALYGGANDIGNTYVEINLAKQRIWFYKNGSLIVQGDIISGNVRRKYATPKGIYRLKYKARNVVLRGDDYAVSVSYWLPFNGGIGIHDANWRRAFGGRIYMTNGSHGCINSPYSVAKKIFNNIAPGTPIICY